jgi:NAD-dependent DNA ligase/DNA polymerase/3'-5' exonuclease PolX
MYILIIYGIHEEVKLLFNFTLFFPSQYIKRCKNMSQPQYGEPMKIKVTKKKRPDPQQAIAVTPNADSIFPTNQRLNEKIIEILEELGSIMMKHGEPFRARAYQKATESIILYPGDITPANYKNMEKQPGIGSTIIEKLDEYIKTGTLRVLERERENPVNILAEIYGVGPKKAKELVEKGITTIADLRERQSELNNVQKIGLKYYEDILKRIPRKEIDDYDAIFQAAFKHEATGSKMEIVGSYRRGAQQSGDIDVIVTSGSPETFKNFVDTLISQKTLVEILSRGPSKCLAIGKLTPDSTARRIDFLYTSPEEYPFSVLYFTGSKFFNTVMRGRALSMGYSLNEHGMYKMDGKKKGDKVPAKFVDERDIFRFLKMVYKTPEERIDGRAVVAAPNSPPIIMSPPKMVEEIAAKSDLPSPNTMRAILANIRKGSPPRLTNKTMKKKQTAEEKAKEKAKQKEEKAKAKEEAKQKAKEEKQKAKEETRKQKKDLAAKNKTEKKKPKLKILPEKLIINDPSSQHKEKESKQKEQTLGMKEMTPRTQDSIDSTIDHYKRGGIHVLESLSEETLNSILKRTSDLYYNLKLNETPLLTDNEYDVLKEFMEKKFPNNTVISEIGAPVEKNKATLPYQMPSMDKIKPDTGALESWQTKYKGPYVLSCKLDGVSGMYSTETSTTPKLYTRGNGKVGQDITYLIPHLTLPKTDGIVVRGEFIMSKPTFNGKYATQFANARNLVAGVVNRVSVNEIIKDIDFVAYEIIVPAMKPSEQMRRLKELGFKTVQNKTEQIITNKVLSEILVDWRTHYEYEIDGVIVTDDQIYPRKSGNPDHAFAFKMVLSDQMAEAKVVDVIWNASKDGYLKPRVRIEPVQLSGVTIEYATGFNGAFIETNKIGIGAIVQMIRSGDVIPYIKSVVTPATTPLMPTVPYKWNDTHIDLILEDANSDASVLEKNITGFFRGIEVDGLSAGNVSRIVGAGFNSVAKILAMSKADFLTIEGFKGKMAEKLHSGIEQKVAAASLGDLMAASNMFGRGFSDKKIKLILEEYPDILSSADTPESKTRRLASTKGMATKTAAAFVEHIPAFLKFMDECGLSHKITSAPPPPSVTETKKKIDTENPLYKKTVVMTGARDKDLEKILESMGVTIGSSVNSKTFVLITADKEVKTGKANTARELNVPIMTPEEFRAKYV